MKPVLTVFMLLLGGCAQIFAHPTTTTMTVLGEAGMFSNGPVAEATVTVQITCDGYASDCAHMLRGITGGLIE